MDNCAQRDPLFTGTIITGTPVHHCKPIPHQHIANPPAVVIDKPVLLRMGGQESPLLEFR